MNEQEELQIISNALTFLERTDIKGGEVKAFTDVQQYLGQKGQVLNEKLQMSQQPKPSVPQDDNIVDAVIAD